MKSETISTPESESPTKPTIFFLSAKNLTVPFVQLREFFDSIGMKIEPFGKHVTPKLPRIDCHSKSLIWPMHTLQENFLRLRLFPMKKNQGVPLVTTSIWKASFRENKKK